VIPGCPVRVDPADHSRVGIDFSVKPPSVRLPVTPGKVTAAEVLEKGSACEVVIIQSQPLGAKNQAGLDMYAFMLTVMIPGQAPYQIQVGNPVPPEAVPLIYPGSQLAARIMADAGPEHVVIDWKAALANAAAG
jgi:hypothetical protein